MAVTSDVSLNIDGANFNVLFIKNSTFEAPIQMHSHGKYSYELHYITSGEGVLIANGVSYNLKPNSLFVTGPNVLHEQIPVESNPMNEWCVYLRLTSKEKLSPTIKAFCDTHFWIGEDSFNIRNLFEQIAFEEANQFIGYNSNIKSLLRQLIIAMVRNYNINTVNINIKDIATSLCASTSPSVSTSLNRSTSLGNPQTVDEGKNLIIEEYFLYNYKKLSLTALAQILGLSNRQTERTLMSFYGKNFATMKLEARMSAATTLLQSNKKSITEIASELGYSSTSHFCDAFKQYYNVTPGAYKKRSI